MTPPVPPSARSTSKGRHRATIADVARMAEVAPMTVSRVLTGAAAVRPDKVKRIQEAIQLLRYKPNETARALRSQRSRIIGLIVPRLSDPFFATIAHAVNNVAVDNGYSVLITTSNDEEETEYSQAQLMVLRGVEGIVIIPGAGYHSKLNRQEFEHICLVALDKPIDEPSIDSVFVENFEGSRTAVEHLIGHGHQRITCISDASDLYTLSKRQQGYEQAMMEHDLKINTITDCTAERASDRIRQLMQSKYAPTAIFTTNGPATRNVLHTLLQLGVKLPDDLALIGFDDFEFADMLQTSLTVIRQPASEMGRIAALRLFEQIQDDIEPHIGKVITLPVELVIRRSCGCKPRPSTTPRKPRASSR